MANLKDKMKQSILMVDDEEQLSNIIDSLIDVTIQEFCVLMGIDNGMEELINKYHFIPINVFKARFNRLEREGITSYSQSEQSFTFDLSDFDVYQGIIDDYKAKQDDSFGVGYQWL